MSFRARRLVDSPIDSRAIKKVVQRLQYPYGDDCILSTEEFDSLYGGSYSFLSCQKTCLQRAILDKCECTDELVTGSNSGICSVLNSTQIKWQQIPDLLPNTSQPAANPTTHFETFGWRSPTVANPTQPYYGAMQTEPTPAV
ncbi:hypothetical protein Bbelb_026400 [Branchiostoma belcheri]|nr:hypothetical protein Bbelb_026400 [Branchiostoma belcheri]